MPEPFAQHPAKMPKVEPTPAKMPELFAQHPAKMPKVEPTLVHQPAKMSKVDA
jgi:hypothetical protein